MKLSGWHSIAYVNIGANLMDIPIDVDKDNQWKHDSEFAKIIKKCMTQVLYPYIQDID